MTITKIKNRYVDLSCAPWIMHDFFAGNGLVVSLRRNYVV